MTFYGSVLGVVQLREEATRAGRTRDGVGEAAALPNPPARKKFSIFDFVPEGASVVFSSAREAVLGSRKAAFWETCVLLAFCCVLGGLRSENTAFWRN